MMDRGWRSGVEERESVWQQAGERVLLGYCRTARDSEAAAVAADELETDCTVVA